MENLIEAYLSVYEESDIDEAMIVRKGTSTNAAGEQIPWTHTHNTNTGKSSIEDKFGKRDARRRNIVSDLKSAKRSTGAYRIEQADLYDLVLDHLLDEGYADTEENAITIMANMSEEWIDEIIDEASVYGARKGTIRSVIEKGGKSIKYVQSGGDIVAGDRAAQARASAASRTRDGRNRANAARFQQAAKKSIQTLNANPGEDPENYGNTDDDHSGGERHYKLKHTNRADRQRRASGR